MRKLIIISETFYVRNYLRTDAFASILDDSVFMASAAHLSIPDWVKERCRLCGEFSYNTETTKAHVFFRDVLMLRRQNRSSAFRFRFFRHLDKLRYDIARSLQGKKELSFYRGPIATLFAIVVGLLVLRKWAPQKFSKFAKRGWELLLVYLLGRPVFAWLAQCAFERKTKPNPDIERILNMAKPELVIIPTNAVEPVVNDLLRLRAKYKYKTLLLLNNWDNLSSKSVFPYPPDYLGVWGRQSVEHAEVIHRLNRAKVFELGAPHFDGYFDFMEKTAADQRRAAPYPFQYILFVGCYVAFDETAALVAIDRICADWNLQSEQKIKVVYRPHPWREPWRCEARFDETEFSHVVLDHQMRANVADRINRHFQPDLAYYPPLVANARLVIGPLTSMLLEASLFRKPVLALAYDDEMHLTSPHNAYKYFPHFRGIDEIPGFTLVREAADLPRFVTYELGHERVLDSKAHAAALGRFLHLDGRRYPDRLRMAVREIERMQSYRD